MKKYVQWSLIMCWVIMVFPSVFSQTEQVITPENEKVLTDESPSENLEKERLILSELYSLVQRLQDSVVVLEQRRLLAEQQISVVERRHKREKLALQSKIKESELQILKLQYEYETAQEKTRRQEQKIQAMELQLRSNELVMEMQSAEIKRLERNRWYWVVGLGAFAWVILLWAVWLYRKKQRVEITEKIATATKTVEVPTPQIVPSSPMPTLTEPVQPATDTFKKKLEETELVLASERNMRLQTQAELAKCNQLLASAKQTIELHQIQTNNIRALLLPDSTALQTILGKCITFDNVPQNETPHYFYQVACPYEQMAVLTFVTVEAPALDRTFLMVLGQQIFKQVVEIEKYVSPEEVVTHFYRLFVKTCQQKNKANDWKLRLAVVIFDKKVSKVRIACVGLQVAWYEFNEWKLLAVNPNLDLTQSPAEVIVHTYTLSKNSEIILSDIPADQLTAIAHLKDFIPPTSDTLQVILRLEEPTAK